MWMECWWYGSSSTRGNAEVDVVQDGHDPHEELDHHHHPVAVDTHDGVVGLQEVLSTHPPTGRRPAVGERQGDGCLWLDRR